MVLLLRKRHLLTVVAAVALCGALLLTARPGAAAVSGSASPQRAVILDAGHGGADGLRLAAFGGGHGGHLRRDDAGAGEIDLGDGGLRVGGGARCGIGHRDSLRWHYPYQVLRVGAYPAPPLSLPDRRAAASSPGMRL